MEKSVELNRFDIQFSVVLCVLLIITRIPFISKFLYDYDSVNFALAVKNFDITSLQPHPPGYIFYVAFVKIINLVFNDPNSTMIFINLIFSILTVLIIYFLAKQMFSRKIAIVSAALLIFNPIFWFYGEIAAIYMSDALFASLIAYTSYQIFKGKEKFIYISAMVLGLSGGFRTDLIVFMFPLWLFTIFHSKINYRKIINTLLIVIVCALMWYIPTILLSGGYANYNLLNSSQLLYFFKIYSLFLGGSTYYYFKMLNLLISWTLLGIGLMGTIILLLFIIRNYQKILELSNFRNPKLIFLILWILPAFIFYLLIFIPKSGYTLIYLPSLSIIVGYVVVNFSLYLSQKIRKNQKYFIISILILCITFNVFQFYTNNDFTTYNDIKRQDELYFNSTIILTNTNKFNPENTIIITNNENLYRKLSYSFRNYEIYGYSSLVKALWYGKPKYYLPTLKSIQINSDKEYIVWILDNKYSSFPDLKNKINLIQIQSENEIEISYSNIKNEDINLEIDGITITNQ